MRIAVIDCGTNTFNLLVVELQNASFKRIYTSKIPVKLGEGGINNKVIHKIPFKRGVDALVKFKNELNKLAVVEIYAFATSAIRDAENGIDFKKEVLIQSGIEINIIDGNKEAELIYKGNKLAMDLGTGPSLIMDIGGGSTEFIIGNKEHILWKKSYRLGAARMLEKFNPSPARSRSAPSRPVNGRERTTPRKSITASYPAASWSAWSRRQVLYSALLTLMSTSPQPH